MSHNGLFDIWDLTFFIWAFGRTSPLHFRLELGLVPTRAGHSPIDQMKNVKSQMANGSFLSGVAFVLFDL